MKSLVSFSGLAILTGLSACSGPMVETRYDHSAHFAELKTFAWTSPAGQFKTDQPEKSFWDEHIRSAVENELSQKGFIAAASSPPDLLLSYEVSTEEKVDATYLENYETAKFMGLTYTLGTLTLVMTRATPAADLWRGSVHANIEKSRSPEERLRRLQDAVQGLLKKFPPTR